MEQVVQTEEVTTVHQEQPAQVVHTTTKVVPPVVHTEHPQQVYEKRKVIFRAYQVIWYILGVIEVLLGFRMTLQALGANPTSGFTSLIYALSNPLALPFRGILPLSVSGGQVFEWSIIIAVIVYAVIAYGIVYLFQLVKPVSQAEVSSTVDNP
jgi:hypothetical protein